MPEIARLRFRVGCKSLRTHLSPNANFSILSTHLRNPNGPFSIPNTISTFLMPHSAFPYSFAPKPHTSSFDFPFLAIQSSLTNLASILSGSRCSVWIVVVNLHPPTFNLTCALVGGGEVDDDGVAVSAMAELGTCNKHPSVTKTSSNLHIRYPTSPSSLHISVLTHSKSFTQQITYAIILSYKSISHMWYPSRTRGTRRTLHSRRQ